MAKFRLDTLDSLARQMTFTPRGKLLVQLAAAEELLHTIDPTKAYPLEFIIFRITGYHPRRVAGDLLTGIALQHDLGLLIERLSETLNIRSQDLAEPVLSIDDVTERFNVTSKTIQRWRRRGLPARRFIFPDGRRRVGFLLSSVEQFFTAHREQVPHEANLSKVSESETQYIVRRALMLAHEGGCWESEISRRIAKRLNRSPATILHIIRKHDQENPGSAVLPWAPIPIPQDERAWILRAHRRGTPISELAAKYHQSRGSIYRVVIDERIARLNRRKSRFIDDPLYHEPNAMEVVEEIASQDEIRQTVAREELRVPRDLPPYLQELYRTPLLTTGRERALFLEFNFRKFQFVQARKRLDPQFARAQDLDLLEKHLRDAVEAKNKIVGANLRLVVSVARRHLRPGLNLMELISDGNITLMRAVEGFDIHKGYRFSTYATLSLMKGFARSVPQMQAAARALAGDALLGQVPDTRMQRASDGMLQRDELRQLLSKLDERERRVLFAHYGIDDQTGPATFDEVGRRLGLSKHRVRQIEQAAMAKLRGFAEAAAAPMTTLPR